MFREYAAFALQTGVYACVASMVTAFVAGLVNAIQQGYAEHPWAMVALFTMAMFFGACVLGRALKEADHGFEE